MTTTLTMSDEAARYMFTKAYPGRAFYTCPHGRLVGVGGSGPPGELLPELEHCDQCRPTVRS